MFHFLSEGLGHGNSLLVSDFVILGSSAANSTPNSEGIPPVAWIVAAIFLGAAVLDALSGFAVTKTIWIVKRR